MGDWEKVSDLIICNFGVAQRYKKEKPVGALDTTLSLLEGAGLF